LNNRKAKVGSKITLVESKSQKINPSPWAIQEKKDKE
jgi:hypothetical protein